MSVTRYAVVDRADVRVAVLVARDGAVDCAPDVIAYVRTRPIVEALALLGAAGLHLIAEGTRNDNDR